MPETASQKACTPSLVRLFVPLPEASGDPWALGRALQPVFGAPVALFSDPVGALEFCALGTAWAAVLPHNRRFAAAREALGRLRKDSITLGPMPAVVGPTMLCAFAFEGAFCGREGPFGPLDGGLALVPTCLVQRGTSPSGAPELGVLLQLMVPASDDLAHRRAQATLEGWAQAVQRIAAKPWATETSGAASVTGARQGDECATQAGFEAAVSRAQAALGPKLHKVVLARRRSLAVQVAPAATAWALRADQGQATTFSLSLPGGGHFLGATPETLIRLAAGTATTHALAGTAARGTSPQADAQARDALLTSSKDLGEHALVVTGMVQALTPWVEELGHPQAACAVALPRMWHLHTPICATVKPHADVLALAAALHPTPALGGQPQKAAQRYLAQHESFRRGLYAAPLGWVNLNGDGVFVAGIRSLWCDASDAVLFAGAGIVAASDPKAEWRETELKLTTAQAGLRVRPRSAKGPS